MGAYSTITVSLGAARKAWVEDQLLKERKKLYGLALFAEHGELEAAAEKFLEPGLYNCRIVSKEHAEDDSILEGYVRRAVDEFNEEL